MSKLVFNRWIKVSGSEVVCSRNNLYDFPATYVVYANEKVIYIGHSNSLRVRFFNHGIRKTPEGYVSRWGNFVDLYIKVKYSKNYGKEAMIEKRLIFKIKPAFNKQSLWYLKYKGSI